MVEAVTASKAVARAVGAIRRRRGWSQEELARRLVDRRDEKGRPVDSDMDVRRATVAKIEAGGRGRISIDEAVTLAAVLGVSVIDLLDSPSGVVVAGWGVPPEMFRDWLFSRAPLPIQDDPDLFRAEHRWVRELDAERIEKHLEPARKRATALLRETDKPEPDVAKLRRELRLLLHSDLKPPRLDPIEMAKFEGKEEG